MQGRQGGAGLGWTRRGEARQARRGMAWLGRAGRGRQGVERRGMARTGTAGNFINRRNKMKYTFREGNRVSGVDAQTAGIELDRIYQKHGAIKPKTIVDESRPDDAPLHPAFEWNDAIAADEWRVHTARNLIRSVQVINDDKKTEPVYVSVQAKDNEREYQPMSVVVQKVDLYASAVYEAQCRINAAEKALNDLKNAAERENKDDLRLAAINIAMKALATASEAVHKLQ